MALCNIDGCRLLRRHLGIHSKFPTTAWNFFEARDKKKLTKAGFATPRGGAKNAYQNHVLRNNRVIIPFEKFDPANFQLYEDGYVIRILPEQYFSRVRRPRRQFVQPNAPVQVGVNAFVLYRTWASFTAFPPLQGWRVRSLLLDGLPTTSRERGVVDVGEYVLRLSTHGANPARQEGAPQGIFATEYADEETNYLSKCVLALLIINSLNSPYTHGQAGHLIQILQAAGILDYESFENTGVIRRNHTCCPLCLKIIRYNEFHDTISFEESEALANAGNQSEGSTRSTIVNLFHLKPLIYHSLTHIPENLGWGHAVCNTYLAQRTCYSLSELEAMGLKVGVIYEDHVETFGWISNDLKFIRSPNGAVWIQISSDMNEEELGLGEDEEWDLNGE